MIVGDITGLLSEVSQEYSQLNSKHDSLIKLGDANFYIERDLILLKWMLFLINSYEVGTVDDLQYINSPYYNPSNTTSFRYTDKPVITKVDGNWVQTTGSLDYNNLTATEMVDVLKYLNMKFNTNLTYNFLLQ